MPKERKPGMCKGIRLSPDLDEPLHVRAIKDFVSNLSSRSRPYNWL